MKLKGNIIMILIIIVIGTAIFLSYLWGIQLPANNISDIVKEQRLIVLITHIIFFIVILITFLTFWIIFSRQFKQIKEKDKVSEEYSNKIIKYKNLYKEFNQERITNKLSYEKGRIKLKKEYEKLKQENFAKTLEVEQANNELIIQSKEQEKLKQELLKQKFKFEQTNSELYRCSKEQEKLNQELFTQRMHVEQKNIEIEDKMQENSDKNTILNSTLNFAKTIQRSIMLNEQKLHDEYQTELVYFPKDIVSGDFYWTANVLNKRKLIAVVDCTEHGVPGAFLSFVSSRSLEEIVHTKQIFQPKEILNFLDKSIKKVLNQEYFSNCDGMDIALCATEETKEGKIKIIFSGAKLPMFYYKKNEKKVNYINGSRKSIGGEYFDNNEFEEHELLLEKEDILYITTDGFIEQGNTENKRFGRNTFIKMIEALAEFDIEKQKNFMKQIFEKYRENATQRDDVTVLIVKL